MKTISLILSVSLFCISLPAFLEKPDSPTPRLGNIPKTSKAVYEQTTFCVLSVKAWTLVYKEYSFFFKFSKAVLFIYKHF